MKIAVVGAGAVGCYFGGMLARAGARVTLIGRQQHVDAILRDGLLLDVSGIQERVKVSASTELSAVRESEIILFCVKTVDTETVARSLGPHLPKGAVVISLQNGVDNVRRIYESSGIEAVSAVVYVAAAMASAGHVKHSGGGRLIIDGANPKLELETVTAMFEDAGIPCRISQSIDKELWIKMTMNCAYNAISALGRARYMRILQSSVTRDLMEKVIMEVVAVAQAGGITLSGPDMVEAALKLGNAMAEATSSTAQDIERGRPTEIDSLNGYVVRRGEELDVPVPINFTLYALIKLLDG